MSIINSRAEESSFSGWYFDEELSNRMTSCTLHPNQKQKDVIFNLEKENKYGEKQVVRKQWVNITEEDGIDDSDAVGGQEVKYPYSITPICSSIFTDDFTVNTQNSWSPFGGDAIGELWKNLKPLASYAEHLSDAFKTIGKEQAALSPEMAKKVNSTPVSKFLSKFAQAAGEFASKQPNGGEAFSDEISDYLNRCLKVQGTRFSYYNGTNVSFGNLSMKFTIFPKWSYSKDGNLVPRFESVTDQVEKIYPYVVGRYLNLEQDNTTIGQMIYSGANKISPDIKNYIGWECPPGGFRADTKNVDVIQRGTLKLKLGPWFSITNLVCSSASFTFSKQMVKNPTAYSEETGIKTDGITLDKGNSLLSPLYCDVSLELTPVTEYSDESLRRFVSAANNAQTVSRMNTNLWDRLEEEKTRLRAYSENFK